MTFKKDGTPANSPALDRLYFAASWNFHEMTYEMRSSARLRLVRRLDDGNDFF